MVRDPGYTRLSREVLGVEQVKALTFSYNNAGQDIIFSPDAISGISDSLDQVGAARAMVVCGPSILRGSDVSVAAFSRLQVQVPHP